MRNWQKVIKDWIIATLGPSQFESTHERAMRFAEESAELCQAVGLSENDFMKVTKHVFTKPEGDKHQEFGGVMTTLCALAENQNESLLQALQDESDRIHRPEIQKKVQAATIRKRKEGMGM